MLPGTVQTHLHAPVDSTRDAKVHVQEEGLRIPAAARELTHRPQTRQGNIAHMSACGQAVPLQLAARMLQIADHQRISLQAASISVSCIWAGQGCAEVAVSDVHLAIAVMHMMNLGNFGKMGHNIYCACRSLRSLKGPLLDLFRFLCKPADAKCSSKGDGVNSEDRCQCAGLLTLRALAHCRRWVSCCAMRSCHSLGYWGSVMSVLTILQGHIAPSRH